MARYRLNTKKHALKAPKSLKKGIHFTLKHYPLFPDPPPPTLDYPFFLKLIISTKWIIRRFFSPFLTFIKSELSDVHIVINLNIQSTPTPTVGCKLTEGPYLPWKAWQITQRSPVGQTLPLTFTLLLVIHRIKFISQFPDLSGSLRP